MRSTRYVHTLAALLLACSLPACMRNCVPRELADPKRQIDLCAAPGAHAPADRRHSLRDVEEEFRRRAAGQHPPGARPYKFLALSSGGLYGAYGVGVLKGWTDSGTRPTFDVVTGVSTGALMSTFAFLGPKYDHVLQDTYIGTKTRDFLRPRRIFAIPLGQSRYSSQPLARRIESELTTEVLTEVADAHKAGRRLYVATTNLDSRHLTIWDMGAIAARRTEESRALYRQIVLASSSIPGALPPVLIDVEIDGKHFKELHVDGAVCDEVVFRPFMVGDLNREAGGRGPAAPPGSTLHVINNGKLYSQESCVRGILGIIKTSVGTVITNKARDEMFRIYLSCMESGVAYRSTEVPRDLKIGTDLLAVSVPDQELLFKTGYQAGQKAASGEGWRDQPAGVETGEQVMPRTGTKFATGPRQGPPAGPSEACKGGGIIRR